MERKKTIAYTSIGVALLVALDQLSKQLIERTFNLTESREVIAGFFELTYVRNPSASWGIDLPMGALIGITIFALLLFGFLMKDGDFRTRSVYTTGLMLLIAGTIGNFIDRLALGYVIDFLDFYLFTYDYPVFNVADMCLTIGIALFAFDLIVLDRRRQRQGSDA